MKRFYFALLTLFLFYMPFNAISQDYLGGFIRYSWFTGDTLYIQAWVYSDCTGGPLGPGSFRIKAENCGFDTAVAYQVISTNDVTPRCNTISCTKCSDPNCSFPYGIAQNQLVAKVGLGHINCCEFDIQLKECCRSGIFTTLDSNQSFFLSSFTDRCSGNLSSPDFSGPSMLRCVGQCITEALTINSRPNNSIIKLVSPMSDEDTLISYVSPYSYDKPLYFFGFPNNQLAFNPPQCRGFHVDSIYGNILYRPMQAQTSLMTIKVEQFDSNGTVTGFIHFDIPQIITNCPNNDSPELTGINGSSSQFSTTAYVGQQLCFNIYSSDQNNLDSVTISWNAGIPGATFLVTKNGKYQNGRFCWTPQPGDENKLPYLFTIEARDNACPITSQTVRSYLIYVVDSTVSINRPPQPDLKIYPNPAKDLVQVELPQNISSYTLQLISAEGKLVKRINADSGQPIIIRRDQLAAGMYLLELRVEENSFYYPIIFQ